MSRRSLLSLALAFGLGFVGARRHGRGVGSGHPDVTMDEAKIARIPDGTVTLVIGNPIVADVTMLKGSGAMVVTGKGFGETNLIALDAQGNVLDEKTIRVVPTASTLARATRNGARKLFLRAQCMPTVQLGDGKLFSDASGQITARNGLTQPSTGHADRPLSGRLAADGIGGGRFVIECRRISCRGPFAPGAGRDNRAGSGLSPNKGLSQLIRRAIS